MNKNDLANKVQKLKQELADVKTDVHFLKAFLLKLNEGEEQVKDDEELQKIEQSLGDV